jgi:hypothetical protein
VAARFLIDTNICTYIRRRRPPAVLERFRQLTPGEAVLSVITYGELVYGAEKSQFRDTRGKEPVPGTSPQAIGRTGGLAPSNGAPDARRRALWVYPRHVGSRGAA